jgi:hypothetical protein
MRPTVLIAMALLTASCANANLGRSVPACPPDRDAISQITATMVLQMQAVDSAEYVPCLNDLNAGWTYEDLVPQRGESRFWLDSDRLGTSFLEVTLTAACDVSGLSEIAGSEADVAEYRDVDLIGSTVTVVIVPVTGREKEKEYAQGIEAELEARQVNDRQVFVVFDDDDAPLADKIDEARQRDRPIIVVDEQDVAFGTATLQMPDDDLARRGLDVDDMLDALEDRLPEPSFTGTWARVFEGGCITYEFDAKGPGVDRLADEVEDALGLFPAGEVRRAMRAVGLLG